MSKLGFDSKIMDLFYMTIIESVLSFCITCWYGNSTEDSKCKISRIIAYCSRLGVSNVKPLYDIYKHVVLQRGKVIVEDAKHPLHPNYEILPSGLRLRSIRCRTARYSKSFVPSSIKLMNDLGQFHQAL